MSAKKTVSFPELMDSYGINLTKVLAELKEDALKTALVSDVSKNVQLLWNFQQLMTVMYNINVQNYDVLMNKIIATEQKAFRLEDRIVAVEQKITKLEENITKLEKKHEFSVKDLIKEFKENSECRQLFKKLLT